MEKQDCVMSPTPDKQYLSQSIVSTMGQHQDQEGNLNLLAQREKAVFLKGRALIGVTELGLVLTLTAARACWV